MQQPTRLVIGIWLIVLSGALGSWSMEPPRPGEIDHLQATGELEDRLVFAHAIGNHRFDPDLVQRRLQDLVREGNPTPPEWWQGMPTSGDVRIFAVLIAFADYPFSNSVSSIDNELFGAGNPADFPTDSLAEYYARSSYGLLDFSGGSTLGWYTTAYDRSSVQQNAAGRHALLREVLSFYDAQGHDFSQYDNDGDGTIDYFVVIWTGPDTGWGNFWWGYQTRFFDQNFILDGKTLGKYSWQWEANPEGGDFTARVVVHETGHALGLPDYYDYDDGVGPPGGVGYFDMMDGVYGDHNCFSKWMLDWITPTVVGYDNQSLTLGSSGTTQDAVMIMPGADESKLFSEYFMVQNRCKTGNDDQWFPTGGEGMVIWHVDARVSDGNFEYDNSYTEHKLLRLMEADGLEEIEQGNHMADAGDYFNSGAAFDDTSLPNSQTYDGHPTAISVSAFGPPGPTMSATFAVLGSIFIDGFDASGSSNWSFTTP